MKGIGLAHSLLQLAIRTVKRTPLLGRLAERFLDRFPKIRVRAARVSLRVYWRAMRRPGVEDLSPQSKRVYADITSAIRARETSADPR